MSWPAAGTSGRCAGPAHAAEPLAHCLPHCSSQRRAVSVPILSRLTGHSRLAQRRQGGAAARRHLGWRGPAARASDASVSLGAGGALEGGSRPLEQAAAAAKAATKDRPLVRLLSGLLLGALGGVAIYAGGFLFTGVVCLCSYQVCQEFYGFVTSKGVASGRPPSPQGVTVLISLLCTSLALFTYLSKGKATAALAVATFAVLSVQLITAERIGMSELAETVLGLFYCGYLPSYWVKLRLLAVPSTATAAAALPAALGGGPRWTVGLTATLLSVACIVAADVGAYCFGKTLGRRRLHAISPKKTWEGAAGGLACAAAAALGFWRLAAWPAGPGAAVGLGLLCFFGSLFGDLIESVMKRDAGLKDAGNLIPGHGGLLDRVDSFTWVGALVFFTLKFVIGYGI